MMAEGVGAVIKVANEGIGTGIRIYGGSGRTVSDGGVVVIEVGGEIRVAGGSGRTIDDG